MSATNQTADCLIEIGMEELPPKAMPALSAAFHDNLIEALSAARLAHADVQAFAAPRRLALRIDALAVEQPDEALELRGPPVTIAFDDNGKPTKAAEAFAKKNGVAVADLQREKTAKGEWLLHRTVAAGKPTHALLGNIIEQALAALPIPKRMRWGSHDTAFVRPVHWVVVLHADAVVACNILGIPAGRATQGHRFHSEGSFDIDSPASYESQLKAHFVIADFAKRRDIVERVVNDAAGAANGCVEHDDALLDEITALCDWPVAVTGEFDPRFLQLPPEVLTSTLKVHQRYFPVIDKAGAPMPAFITVANIESRDPIEVQRGNQRVIEPRLSDAEFFWQNDLKKPLADHAERLNDIVYQKALGSIADKSARTTAIAVAMCEQLQVDALTCTRAAHLARCDLVTDMVGEFPELQGIMGAYYAGLSGESDAVVAAIRSQYQPAFAGDDIPATQEGQILSAADRIDTLAGIFVIGKKPSGNRDPFGLRRAALGLVRILIEGKLAVQLPVLLKLAMSLQPAKAKQAEDVEAELRAFILDRARSHYRQDPTTARGGLFDAVLARTPDTLLDFDRRMHAVAGFIQRPEAESLAAANKRIGNLLRSAPKGTQVADAIDDALITPGAERTLLDAARKAQNEVAPLLADNDYAGVLNRLSLMRDAVDAFFDDVMVMDEDDAIRGNRLALLTQVRAMFLHVADISELAGASH